MITLAATAASCLLLGFAIGYFGFKIRTSWCPEHGIRLRCPECTSASSPSSPRPVTP